MQLRLETGELNLLADLLLEHISHTQSISAGDSLGEGAVDHSTETCAEVLEKILARNLCLDTDELETVCQLLETKKHELELQIAATEDAALKMWRMQVLAVLQHMLERVDEACAMF